jgi:hypothetical protein
MDIPPTQNQKQNSGLFGVMPNSSVTPPPPQITNPVTTPSSTPPIGQASASSSPPDRQPPVTSQSASEASAPTAIVTSSSPKKSSKFGIFIGVFVFLALCVWGGVAYLYLQNRELKSDIQEQQSGETASLPIPTPTPEFTPEQIQILNGSVVRKRPSGETETLVNKEDYRTTGITGFAKVVVSPDNKKVCFESWPPAPKPALYYANIDGSEVVEIGFKKKNCVWLTDSEKIIYIDDTSAKTSADIYSYDTVNKLETNLTESSVATGVTRRFEVVSLSADGSKIICTYTDVGIKEESGSCEINLETGEVEIIESASSSS